MNYHDVDGFPDIFVSGGVGTIRINCLHDRREETKSYHADSAKEGERSERRRLAYKTARTRMVRDHRNVEGERYLVRVDREGNDALFTRIRLKLRVGPDNKA